MGTLGSLCKAQELEYQATKTRRDTLPKLGLGLYALMLSRYFNADLRTEYVVVLRAEK